MIREVKDTPLDFQKIVTDEVGASLAEHGFRLQPPAYPQAEGRLVPFGREREGQREKIWLGLRLYDAEEMAAGVKEDEVGSPRDDAQGRFWASRHYMSVQIVTNYTNADLLRTGKIGWSDTDEDWWYFKDEEELRQKLHDEVLPLILTVGLQKLDDRLEDIQAEHATQTAV